MDDLTLILLLPIVKQNLYLEAYNNQKQSEISKRKSLSISIF